MKRTNREPRRRVEPALEALEARDLPSSGPLAWGSHLFRSQSQSRSALGETGHDRFFAAFAGPYVAGRGGAAENSGRTIFISGGGNSVAFLHGDILMSIDVPSDSASSNAPTGKASLFVKNYAQTGNVLILDLEGDPLGPHDQAGRPTRFTWSVGEGSSGSFTGADGQGSLEITYAPGGKLPPHAIDAGRAGVKFFGRVRVEKVSNPLRVR